MDEDILDESQKRPSGGSDNEEQELECDLSDGNYHWNQTSVHIGSRVSLVHGV